MKNESTSLKVHTCIYAVLLYFPIQGFGSDKLGCSMYNCTHKGSLLIDLIGVRRGG